MKIGIIGIGLIGGSLAIELKKTIKDVKVFGNDSSKVNLKLSLDADLIDEIISKKEYNNLDVIFLTVPVKEISKQLPEILDLVSSKTLVVDFGSTKVNICEAVSNHPKRSQFLATHPIAGTEFSGPLASKENLFNGKVQIICESKKTDSNHLNWALEWFKKIGMIIKEMTPIDHDKHMFVMFAL